MAMLRDVFLILAVLAVFVVGYFLMVRIDKSIYEKRKAIEKESEKQEPSYVMLTEELSDDEMVKEIRRFREKHENVRVFICDGKEGDLSETIKNGVEF